MLSVVLSPQGGSSTSGERGILEVERRAIRPAADANRRGDESSMPPYRLARLSDEQFGKIEALENEIGVTLVAYEPEADGTAYSQSLGADDPQDSVTDALLDAYRSHP